MKVYFAHSIEDYDEDAEAIFLTYLKDVCQEERLEISNPSEVDVDNNLHFLVMEAKYFLPLIDECDIFYACPSFKSDRYSSGVLYEMNYAKDKGKEIIECKIGTC